VRISLGDFTAFHGDGYPVNIEKANWKPWPEIVDLPKFTQLFIACWIFPVRFLYVYQRVIIINI
jgi:hypothetical protein